MIIPDSVTTIGNHAFRDCSSLTSVTIPDGVTTIGDYVFLGCVNCAVTIGANVVSKMYGYHVWNEKYSYYAYYHNESYPLRGCKTVIIKDGVTKISDGAFYYCSELTNVTIPNSVTTIGDSAFYGCSAHLTSITYTGDLKGWCEMNGIGSLLVEYGAANRTLTIGGAEITDALIIPDGVTTIGDGAFWACRKLTSITIGNSVTTIGANAFYDCSSLTSITYTGDLKGWCEMNGLNNLMPYGTSDKTLTIGGAEITGNLIIPDGVTSIGLYAFLDCTNLVSVVIPNSVMEIGYGAFNYCTSLATIEFASTVEQWENVTKGYNWNSEVPATKVVCTDGEVTL